jgi:hypothetical protein
VSDQTGNPIDDRIEQLLDELQPRTRQRAGYKSDYIARYYDKLERAHRELGWSYKDLAEFLTKEGRPTKVPTLKYNMKKIAAQRRGETTRPQRTQPLGQARRQSQRHTTVESVKSDGNADKLVTNAGADVAVAVGSSRVKETDNLSESAGTIRRFER